MIKKETGEERKFSTGAKRQHAEGKGTPVLFPGDAYLDICKHFEDGAIHYGGRNWEKGLPLSTYIDSLERHVAQEKMGLTDESHDRAIAWNAICYLATKLRIKAGILPKELDDLEGVYGKEMPRHAEVSKIPEDLPIPHGFSISKCASGYYVRDFFEGSLKYLWKTDLKFHRVRCSTLSDGELGNESYHKTKKEAERTLQLFKNIIGYCDTCRALIANAKDYEAVLICKNCIKIRG